MKVAVGDNRRMNLNMPGADAFVKVGDRVKKGDTLCIIEAMKLMNELPSEVSGIVKEISVDNSQAISFGEVIIKIEKDLRASFNNIQ
jgi:biotin carboxyl carrier protein